MNYNKITKLCNSCTGCNKLEDPNFKGTDDCHGYRPSTPRNNFIDNIIKGYEQEKIKKV